MGENQEAISHARPQGQRCKRGSVDVHTGSRQLAIGLIQLAALLVVLLTVSVIPYARAEDSASALSEMVSKVRTYTLSNGIKVIFYQRGEAPIFAGAVVVRVG
jgi:hypothetical protein